MRKIIALAAAVTLLSGAAFAQSAGGVKVQQSSNPDGVQIQGNTNINANAQNVNTTAIGQGNTADAAVGAIRGGTQIQGNTNINANAKNVNTTAIGQGNTAKTTVGGIGK
ncbi:conserved exported hypothetical protein [Candidatus Terasakiella magnetica]|nr:conserved exported hypothetical protein [Candidatus Terasakiella magnetica]